MSEPRMPDNLEAFLQNPPLGAADGKLRAELLEHTSTLLPRSALWPRWPIYLSAVACLVLVFVAGYVLARLRQVASTQAANVERAIEEQPAERQIAPRPRPAPEQSEIVPKPAAPVDAPSPDPRQVEWSAFDAANPRDRVRLYFRAGDLYLDKHDDVAGALRCYQQALAYSEARDLEPNPDDNWLVLALKRDHRKEN